MAEVLVQSLWIARELHARKELGPTAQAEHIEPVLIVRRRADVVDDRACVPRRGAADHSGKPGSGDAEGALLRARYGKLCISVQSRPLNDQEAAARPRSPIPALSLKAPGRPAGNAAP